jgi:hypothetical protein
MPLLSKSDLFLREQVNAFRAAKNHVYIVIRDLSLPA